MSEFITTDMAEVPSLDDMPDVAQDVLEGPESPLRLSPAASWASPEVDPVLERFEQLVEAVLPLPPPSVPCSDPHWVALFRWCDRHRVVLAARARRFQRKGVQSRLDLWLRELATPPKGQWEGVRYGALPFIRMVGLPPRGDGETLFTAVPRPRHQTPRP